MTDSDLFSRDPGQLPALTLAYIGDVVYELYVRCHLIEKGLAKVQDLHKGAVLLVQAKTQAAMAHAIESQLSEAELSAMRRGRNAKGHPAPKGASVTLYRQATGVEALVGYWYLQQNQERLDWFFNQLWQMEGALQHGSEVN